MKYQYLYQTKENENREGWINAKNRAEKTAMKTSLKKFDAAVNAGDKDAAASTFKAAVQSVDRAAGKGLIHKNKAAHQKSAMAKKLNGLG